MSFLDKLFKKNSFDKKLDDAYEDFLENNPVTKKVKATISQAQEEITGSLEEELYGKTGEGPSRNVSEEEMMRGWDTMIDQIIDKELSAYKICPYCGEAVSSELDTCPYCETELPETTAACQICPHCGAKNRILDFTCVNCGKELELIPEAAEDD